MDAYIIIIMTEFCESVFTAHMLFTNLLKFDAPHFKRVRKCQEIAAMLANGFRKNRVNKTGIFFHSRQGLSYICTLRALFMLKKVCPVGF